MIKVKHRRLCVQACGSSDELRGLAAKENSGRVDDNEEVIEKRLSGLPGSNSGGVGFVGC